MGYAGKILRIDLTTGKIEKEPTSSYASQYIGGRGIDGRIVYEEVTPEMTTLSPDNVIVFGTGPLTGTMFPGTGRTDIISKSPETEFLGNTNLGGYWAPELKYAGYDHLVIKGKADKPVYISIDNENVKIRDASSVWGKDTYATEDEVKRRVGIPDVGVVVVGPAGENRVRFAVVENDYWRSSGRTGMGAVLGAKKIKAIAFRGKQVRPFADQFDVYGARRALLEEIENFLSPEILFAEARTEVWSAPSRHHIELEMAVGIVFRRK